MNRRVTWGIMSGLLAGIVAMFYWYFALVLVPDGMFGVQNLGNIKCYAVLVILFLCLFSLFFAGFNRIKWNVLEYPVSKYIFAAGGFCVVLYLIYPYAGKVWGFPAWTAILTGALISLFICGALTQNTKGSRSILFLIGLFGILWGLAAASVNTFRAAPHAAFYDLHHSSAYIDSIFNVFRQMPYEGGITDQYGHYALFFYLPVKLFGCSTVTIAVLLGLLSAAAYILCMTSFCMVVKSNVIRVAAVLVCGLAGINPALMSIYWQCYPHRLIFPAITIFMITFFSKKGLKRWQYIAGTAVMAFALLWNFESGIICSIAWFAFSVMTLFQKEAFTLKKLAVCGMALLVDVVLPFLVAMGIVNLYNILVSDGNTVFLGVREFIGMVVDDSYISYLRTDLPWGNEIYMHKMIVFMLCLCWGIVHNKIFGVEGNKVKANFSIAVSVMGLGLLTYYMNRTLAGSALVDLPFTMCLGIMLSGILELAEAKWQLKKVSLACAAKAVCGIYACLFLVGYGMLNLTAYGNFQERYSTKVYDYAVFQDFARQVGQVVPEDTWAKGEGTSAIYMELGRKNKAYEFGDVTTEDIKEHDKIFIINKYYEFVPEQYELTNEFAYNDVKFGYFVRK